MSSGNPFWDHVNQRSLEGMMREQMVRLHYLFRGDPSQVPMPNHVDTANIFLASSLRDEMVAELRRLKAIMRGGNLTRASPTNNGNEPAGEEERLEDSEDASPEEESDDSGGEPVFRSLRDEMLQELRRLQEIMGGRSCHDKEKSMLSGFDRVVFDRFMRVFSRCAICGKENHESYLEDFFFSPKPEKAGLRDAVVRLIRKTEHIGDLCSESKVFMGIPCCDCYKKIFRKFTMNDLLIYRQDGLDVLYHHEFIGRSTPNMLFRNRIRSFLNEHPREDACSHFRYYDQRLWIIRSKLCHYVLVTEGSCSTTEKEQLGELMDAFIGNFEARYKEAILFMRHDPSVFRLTVDVIQNIMKQYGIELDY
ncbi:MAG: hypothetical protein ACFFCS_18780 [Candidatus Hodarchaeota archaeon]